MGETMNSSVEKMGVLGVWLISALLVALFGLSMCATAPPSPPHWPECPGKATGNNATVFFDKDDLGLQVGDQFAVFVDGVGCVGAATVGVGNVSLTVWGDDSVTPEKDGAAAGDTLRLRVHLDRPAAYTLRDTTGGQPFRFVPTYAVDALYQVTSFDAGGGSAALIDSLQTALDLASNAADSLQAVAANASNRADSLQTVANGQASTINAQQQTISDQEETISDQSETISTQSQKINDAVAILSG